MADPIVDLDAIPDPLQSRDQWLHWDRSNDTPRRPHCEGNFSVAWSDPDEWLSFQEASQQALVVDSWGIGYVTAANNDDCPMGMISVIDLDDAVTADGELAEWVPDIDVFLDNGKYVEWSPSHNEPGPSGLHIPVVGTDIPEWWTDVHIDGEHAGADVLSNKFCTVTGDRYGGAGDDLATWSDSVRDWLAALYESITGDAPDRGDAGATKPTAGAESRSYDDEEWLDEETVEEALNHIDPDASYSQWRNVGFALADHFSEHTARRLFEQWSRSGSKYDDDTDRYIDDIVGRGDGGITIATLVHLATEAGWSPDFGHEKPPLDLVAERGDKESASAETDGGTQTASPTATDTERPGRSIEDRIADVIIAAEEEDIQVETARHRIASILDSEFHFVYPEREVRGWRTTLYVYAPDEGLYEPRGEAFVQKHLERYAGDWVTNQRCIEIVNKLKRRNIERGAMFKTEPNKLVVGNGILDLHTGELEPWSPHEYHRTKLEVDWQPDVGEPDAIDEFLHDVVEDRDVQTLYRLIAHSLYKEYVTEKAAMLLGGGQNGKSVFLDLVEQFLGQYNVSHRSLQAFQDDFKANQLEGKLANIHPDMGDESVKDMSVFKKLTGRDTMTADVKYEQPIIFENYATLMFAANEMPVFGEDNHAVWRRWLYLNFPYTFDASDPSAKDPVPKTQLMRRLTDDRELQALLVRCQREIQRWHEGDQWYPDAMTPDEVREQMKKAAEPVYDFATTCLKPDDGEWLPKDEVRKGYRQYATENGLPKMGADRFGERLINIRDFSIEDHRPRTDDGRRPMAYKNVTWSAVGRQVLGLDEPAEGDDQATVNDTTQHKVRIQTIVNELLELTDNEPVSPDMVIGRAMTEMGRVTAENAIEQAKQDELIVELPDGRLADI